MRDRMVTRSAPLRLLLIACLGFACGGEAVGEEFDEAKVLAAARAADDLYQRHLEELTAKLRSGVEADRLQAIADLGRLDDPKAIIPLLPFIDAGNHSSGELIAGATALGHLADTSAVPGLRQLLQNHNDPEVRLAALNALDVIKATASRDYMPKTKDVEPSINGSAMTNLGTLAHAPAADTLARALARDSRPLVRQMCAIGLGRIGDKSQVTVLQDALSDADPGVRRYAAEALVKLNSISSVPYLLMALEGNVAGQHIDRCMRILTGQDFGFDYRDNELKRREAVERGFRWWTDHAADLAR
ncbi:MAG: HEAT repeat domain-containing protein [Planctomycetes bacterium]|nr:HEAT repeat domain-containing protein [Planctomycetota bacterium]